MAKKTSPTKRSLDELRKRFVFVDVVEKWIPHTFIKRDLFNFADLIAITSSEVALVQTTTRSNFNARVAKIKASSEARLWLCGEGRSILVHGWSKKGARGKRKLWELHEEAITLADFEWPDTHLSKI